MSEIDNQQFERLNQVNCGEIVHLQIITATKPIRLKTRLIGIDPSMSVIVAFGNDANWEKALPYIKESKNVVVRLLSNEQQANIIAFRTSIQKIMTIAGRWLVLDYPVAIESAELRQHLRIPLKIEASLLDNTLNNSLAVGSLNDISIQGCAFISQREPALSLNTAYRLSIKSEEDGNTIELPVTLKNIQMSTRGGEFQYGLVFVLPKVDAKTSIQQLILHYLQK